MRLDLCALVFGAFGLACQKAQNPVAVAHGRHFGVGHHNGFVGKIHRQLCAAFDPCGAVANDVIELLFQLVQNLLDTFLGQGVLVAGLRGWQYPKRIKPLVPDQRLFQARFALNDVDKVKDDPALAAHDHVEIAQAHVKIDHDCLEIAFCQCCGNRRSRGCLAYATLARSDDDHFAKGRFVFQLCHTSLSMWSVSSSRKA